MPGGDLIVALDGKKIEDQQDPAQIMNNHRAGDTVRLFTAERKMDVTVTLGEAREQV